MTDSSAANWCSKHGGVLMTTGGCPYCAAEQSATRIGDPQCPHGNFLGSYCDQCVGEKRPRVPYSDGATYEPIGDARPQLWARVYAAEFSACRHGTVIDSQESLQTASDALAMKRARALADAAVRDFDEYYLGGKG